MELRAPHAGRPLGVQVAAIFLVCVCLYAFTDYGGIRSPDNEVVFRAAISCADHGGLDVAEPLETWPGFGVARARDGKDYPIFGPAQSIALAPFVLAGRALDATGWYRGADLPPSFYVGGGLSAALNHTPLRDPEAHALRVVCSSFNVVVAALCVVMFFLVLRRLAGASVGTFLATAFFACGSLLWPYSGTYFSEPLATLFVLASFYGLPGAAGSASESARRASWGPPAAGFCLGIAVATHITAVLFAPFFALLSWRTLPRGERAGAWRAIGLFALGLAIVLALLGAYNHQRFGSVFETGRGVDRSAAYQFWYGSLGSIGHGLRGLLFGGGKSLLLFCPAVVVGLLSWRALQAQHRRLSLVLGTAVVTRLLFIASRTDWHGGFCLGPRYMLPAVPFLLLPIGIAVDAQLRRGNRRIVLVLGVMLVLCAMQQLYFGMGEVFGFLQRIKVRTEMAGYDVFANDELYLAWRWSPLHRLLHGARGPFLLRSAGLDNVTLWILASTVLGGIVLAWTIRFVREQPRSR